MSNTKRLQVMGMDWPYFIGLFLLVVLAMYFNFLPSGLAGQISFLLVMGEAFRYIGDRIPIIKDYLGGGSCVVLFGCAALVMFGIIPADTANATKEFMNGTFINFALAALCCGSIFGMDRDLLIKASIRYIPCILGVTAAILLAGLVGQLLGFGFAEAALYICLPIMGGGTSAGAVPMSQMFGEVLGKDPGEMLAVMTPAVALGNACSIIMAGLLDRAGKARPALTGNGTIMRTRGEEIGRAHV